MLRLGIVQLFASTRATSCWPMVFCSLLFKCENIRQCTPPPLSPPRASLSCPSLCALLRFSFAIYLFPCAGRRIDSMASTCCQPIAHSYPHRSICESGFQFSKPPTSSDALLLGSAARFNLSAMNVPASMNTRLFQAAPHCRPTVRLRGRALKGRRNL
jgi:hypothetical protein